MLSPQAALVYAMVVAAEADQEIAEPEIGLIGDLVNHLPIFRGLDRQAVTEMATRCSEQLARPGGSEAVLAEIRAALSAPLRDLAYALVCDVIAVDSRLQRDEMHILERIRTLLGVEPATARTIERAAQVRFQAA
jgi:uncharacterized tellurite resistance protein B-like protein